MGRRALIGALALSAGLGTMGRVNPTAPAAAQAVPGVQCEAPRSLRLLRFEDGSAKLLCNGRLLVRISVPY